MSESAEVCRCGHPQRDHTNDGRGACWHCCKTAHSCLAYGANRFHDEPNVRSVIRTLAGKDEAAADDAIDRIGQILGLDGWKGTKMFGRYEIGEGIGEQ